MAKHLKKFWRMLEKLRNFANEFASLKTICYHWRIFKSEILIKCQSISRPPVTVPSAFFYGFKGHVPLVPPPTVCLCEIVRQSVWVDGKNTNYARVIVKNCVIPDHLLILPNPDMAVAFLGQGGAAPSPDFCFEMGFLLRIL